jgi:hypothetical protein
MSMVEDSLCGMNQVDLFLSDEIVTFFRQSGRAFMRVTY